ncbi:endonuclease-reverse transcriptase [Elysia marginata]|uniref:Endonuclease-reverse transcriptase n=1 Tax=Elysia marginata TaxID=1093978 RepID=A0AAV4HV00_9GAST|nr:endonuclease-reverse transcriptase [Elysia marginata]
MERKMLKLNVKDKVPYTEMRKRTGVQDVVQFALKQKWKWAGHVDRFDDNRWTQRVTEWQPREGRRARGRQRRRWRDDLVQLKGTQQDQSRRGGSDSVTNLSCDKGGPDSSVGSGVDPWPRGRGFEPQPSTVRVPTGWVGVSIM